MTRQSTALQVTQVGPTTWTLRGYTKPYADDLKAAGAIWDAQKLVWRYEGVNLPDAIAALVKGLTTLEIPALSPVLVGRDGVTLALKQTVTVGDNPIVGLIVDLNVKAGKVCVTRPNPRATTNMTHWVAASKVRQAESPLGEKTTPDTDVTQWGKAVRAQEKRAREAIEAAKSDPAKVDAALDEIVKAVEIGQARPTGNALWWIDEDGNVFRDDDPAPDAFAVCEGPFASEAEAREVRGIPATGHITEASREMLKEIQRGTTVYAIEDIHAAGNIIVKCGESGKVESRGALGLNVVFDQQRVLCTWDMVSKNNPVISSSAFTPPSDVTPLRQQYLGIKAQYPECILFFRLGDFYELFDEDAKLAAKELDLVLTSRPVNRKQRVPMAGVPHHALEQYVAKLVEKGYHVAVCEQISEPNGGGLIDRRVERVVEPCQD